MLLQAAYIRRWRDEPHIRVNAVPITMPGTSSNYSEIFSPVTIPAFLHLIEFLGSNVHATLLVTCIICTFLIPTCPISINQMNILAPGVLH